MPGDQLAHQWRYTDPTKVWVSAAGSGTREHLNATLPPTDPNAKDHFAYLTTDGSLNAPYLKA